MAENFNDILQDFPAAPNRDLSSPQEYESIGAIGEVVPAKPRPRSIDEGLRIEDAGYSPIPEPDHDGLFNYKTYTDAFNAAMHTSFEYSAIRLALVANKRRMDEQDGIEATVSVERAKKEYGIEIDRPITYGEAMLRLELKKDREEALENVSDQFGWDRPVTSLATFLAMGYVYNYTPTALTLTAAMTKVAGPVGTGGSLLVNTAKGFRAFRALQKNARLIKTAKDTGSAIRKLEKTRPFREALKKATPIAAANAAEEIMINEADRIAVGDQYGLEQALIFGTLAPFTVGTAAAYFKTLRQPPPKPKRIMQADDQLQARERANEFEADQAVDRAEATRTEALVNREAEQTRQVQESSLSQKNKKEAIKSIKKDARVFKKEYTPGGTKEYIRRFKMDKRLKEQLTQMVDGKLTIDAVRKLRTKTLDLLAYTEKQWNKKLAKISDEELLIKNTGKDDKQLNKLYKELGFIRPHLNEQLFAARLVDRAIEGVELKRKEGLRNLTETEKIAMKRSRQVMGFVDNIVEGKPLKGLTKADQDVQQFVRRLNSIEKRVPGAIRMLQEVAGATHSLGLKNQDLKKLVPLLDESLSQNKFNKMMKDKIAELQQDGGKVTPERFLTIDDEAYNNFMAGKQPEPFVKPDEGQIQAAQKDIIAADIGAGKLTQIRKDLKKVTKELVDCVRGVPKETAGG